MGGVADASQGADFLERFVDLLQLAVRLGLVIEFIVLDGAEELVHELVSLQAVLDAVLDDNFLELVYAVHDVPGESDALAALDDADDGQLEGKVQQRPDLLADGAKMTVGRVVKVQ